MNRSVDALAIRFGDTALLIGRVLIGGLFLIAAFNKVRVYGGGIGYFERLGIPIPEIMLPLTILFEAAAGIMLIVGYQTRMVALAVAGFCVFTAFLAHSNIGDGNQFNHFLKNLAIAGGALALFATGAGRHSADARNR